jgi:hypothetical protein
MEEGVVTDVDIMRVEELLPVLQPVLEEEAVLVQSAQPALSPDDVLDAALANALSRLRYELNRATFLHLREKVALVRQASADRMLAVRLARQSRHRASAAFHLLVEGVGASPAHFYFDSGGTAWSVVELPACDQPRSGQAACLLFRSHRFARRVRSYPANWRDLSDAELEALSWSR